jgi:predicted nucleic acid-binding protein
MMYLVDTNIFLEILLVRDKKEDCKEFLDKNSENIHLTDFYCVPFGQNHGSAQPQSQPYS